MVWVPAARVLVVNAAEAPDALADTLTAEPKLAPASLNCTVPFGVIPPVFVLTIAVKVSEEPAAVGVAPEVNVTAVVVVGPVVTLIVPVPVNRALSIWAAPEPVPPHVPLPLKVVPPSKESLFTVFAQVRLTTGDPVFKSRFCAE